MRAPPLTLPKGKGNHEEIIFLIPDSAILGLVDAPSDWGYQPYYGTNATSTKYTEAPKILLNTEVTPLWLNVTCNNIDRHELLMNDAHTAITTSGLPVILNGLVGGTENSTILKE